jgi:endonuclease/exonuclease/phosphatase (EEP) superfamily protein YafD
VTLLGATAPFIPYFELINHFRPFVALGIVALVALAWFAGSRRARWFSAAVLAVNAGLLLVPLVYAAETAPRSSLRITTFNLWVGNEESLSDMIRFVTETGADIVIMQEVDARLERALVPTLRLTYPYVASCAQRNCGLLLLSKREPVTSGASDRTPNDPPLVWARFSTGNGHDFTVTGVHLAWPFQPEWQARQIETLIRRFGEAEGTQIIAGDFNLTPFSWKLNRLTAASGLRRHATFGASWPAFPLFPFVLLDNLLSTPDVRSVAVSIASSGYGSDHRPVTFDLALD